MRVERFRKRCGLSKPGAVGFLEWSPQGLVLLTQPFVLALQPIALTLGPFGAFAEVVRLAPSVIVRLWILRFGHAIVMPESPQKYKEKVGRGRDSGPKHLAKRR